MKVSFNKYTLLAIIATVAVSFTSCKDDEFTDSIFDTSEEVLDPNSYTYLLDKFVKETYLEPYNMRFIYKMQDAGTDLEKNLTPATYEKSVQLAALTKYLWYDVYKELASEHDVFLKKYSPRILHIVGSKNYNVSQGTEELGVTEGGVKITLFNVNNLNINDVTTMNEYFFETMHHEFAHMLDQNVIHPTAFNLLSNGQYDQMGWGQAPDSLSMGKGFVSSYASSEIGEDWVETIARYITRDSIQWEQTLKAAEFDWEIFDFDASTLKVDGIHGAYNRDDADSVKFRKYYAGCNRDTIGYYKFNENDNAKVYRKVCSRDANGYVILDAKGSPIWENVDGVDGRNVILVKLELVKNHLKYNFGFDIDEVRNKVQSLMFLKNPDGTWKKDSHGNLISRLASPVEGYPTLMDKILDDYGLVKK